MNKLINFVTKSLLTLGIILSVIALCVTGVVLITTMVLPLVLFWLVYILRPEFKETIITTIKGENE